MCSRNDNTALMKLYFKHNLEQPGDMYTFILYVKWSYCVTVILLNVVGNRINDSVYEFMYLHFTRLWLQEKQTPIALFLYWYPIAYLYMPIRGTPCYTERHQSKGLFVVLQYNIISKCIYIIESDNSRAIKTTFFRFKGVLLLWALFLKTLCIFSKK